MDEKIKQKGKIITILLWVIIIMRVVVVLLSWSLVSLLGLVIPILLLYLVKNKTTKSYKTARIWATVFFLLVMFGGYKSIETMDSVSMTFYVIYICLMGAISLLINSICKNFEPVKPLSPKSKRPLILIGVLIGLLALMALYGYLSSN